MIYAVDKDIVKAVECCLKLRHDCNNCPMRKVVNCTAILKQKILKSLNK